MGRVDGHAEYASGVQVYSRYDIVYDARSQVISEKGRAKQGDTWTFNHTINNYSVTAANANGTPATGSVAIASASRVGSSSGSVLADSKTKYWVSENSGYTLNYGSPGNYDDADLAHADNDSDYIYRWSGVEGGSPLQARVELDNRDSSSSAHQQTDSIYSYDEQGQ